ncbi:MAG: hypothetical protein R2728_05165 [Chitinophagales bacterium]
MRNTVTVGYKSIDQSKKYRLIREERNQLQGIKNDNRFELDIELKHLEKDIFSISILNYKQANVSGFFQWTNELYKLRKYVIIQMGSDGKLDSILNLPEIQNEWEAIRGSILRNHLQDKHAKGIASEVTMLLEDKERFENSLRHTAPYNIFFSGIHNSNYNYDEINFGSRVIPNFIGVKSLPIITEEKLIASASSQKGQLELKVNGELDKDLFDQNLMTDFVKTLKNRPRVVSQLKLKYTEKFKFDSDHWPIQYLNMSLAMVPMFLYREEKVILKEI